MKKAILLLIFSVSSTFLLAQKRLAPSVIHAIDEKIQNTIKSVYGCSVLIAQGNTILLNKSYGFTSTNNRHKVKLNTIFNVASITKAVTAVGILKLVEKHQLKLNDTIGTFLKNVPLDKKNITIHHLLSHTSGLQQNYVCSEVNNSDSAIAKIMNDTLAFVPGSGFEYSNENFELLAAVIEKISGSLYEDFIKKEILKPIKMNKTLFWGTFNDKNETQVAQKLTEICENARQRNWDFLGSGGIYTTPSDLYKFYSAVKSNTLLKSETSDLIFKSHFKTSTNLNIGYGWYVNDSEWHLKEYWTRGNESFGHNAVIRWFPEKDIVVIVCTNSGEIA